MAHRTILQGVSGWFRQDQSGAKIHGDLKGFVPSDRIVRYLLEIRRRRDGMKARAATP